VKPNTRDLKIANKFVRLESISKSSESFDFKLAQNGRSQRFSFNFSYYESYK